jgi:hypothetical protein
VAYIFRSKNLLRQWKTDLPCGKSGVLLSWFQDSTAVSRGLHSCAMQHPRRVKACFIILFIKARHCPFLPFMSHTLPIPEHRVSFRNIIFKGCNFWPFTLHPSLKLKLPSASTHSMYLISAACRSSTCRSWRHNSVAIWDPLNMAGATCFTWLALTLTDIHIPMQVSDWDQLQISWTFHRLNEPCGTEQP